MKKINESTKVTLTLKQLKTLVKEGFEASNNRSKGRIYGSVDITDPVGCERLFAYDIEGETGEVILFGADTKDGVFEVLDELLDREGSTPEGQADFDALVDGVWNLEDGQKFDAWHENGTFGGVYMRLK